LVTREKILTLITESLEDVNAARGPGARIDMSEDVRLFGKGSALDSLEFVTFMLSLEEQLEQQNEGSWDLAAILFDENAGEPFRSVSALADFLAAYRKP